MGPSPVITQDMTPVDKIAEAGIPYVDEVLELRERAEAYLGAMPWCREIVRGWLDYSCGYVVGVFYFQITPAAPDVPSFVWVIVGDIPPAHLDAELLTSGTEAIEGYVAEMQEWVDRVLDGRPLDDSVIPVNVPPEKEWAELLNARLGTMRDMLVPSE